MEAPIIAAIITATAAIVVGLISAAVAIHNNRRAKALAAQVEAENKTENDLAERSAYELDKFEALTLVNSTSCTEFQLAPFRQEYCSTREARLAIVWELTPRRMKLKGLAQLRRLS